MSRETCRKCGGPLRFSPNVKIGARTTDYDNCLAYCDVCRIGISNSRDPERRTYICETLAGNLADPQSKNRYLQVMEQALNQRNRKNKIRFAMARVPRWRDSSTPFSRSASFDFAQDKLFWSLGMTVAE